MVPARAGLVPTEAPSAKSGPSGPRACGGGPSTAQSRPEPKRWSPRVRGWSPEHHHRRVRVRRGPRACGGGPGAGQSRPEPKRWSPRVRGWSPEHHHRRVRVRRGPRACGGGPLATLGMTVGVLWSPRVRGWSRAPAGAPRGRPVVPARAGVVPRLSARGCRAPGGPRACGGGPDQVIDLDPLDVWSPRVRGWSRGAVGGTDGLEVVPARAGVVPGWAGSPWACRRGPRARGWSRDHHVLERHAVVVPAPAGVAPSPSQGCRPCVHGPRPRRAIGPPAPSHPQLPPRIRNRLRIRGQQPTGHRQWHPHHHRLRECQFAFGDRRTR